MSTSLDDIATKVAALKSEQADVQDHWRGVTSGLSKEINDYYAAHKAEVNRASELLGVLTPRVPLEQMTPAQLVLAGRTKVQKARTWLKKNWRVALYVGIALIILYDVIF